MRPTLVLAVLVLAALPAAAGDYPAVSDVDTALSGLATEENVTLLTIGQSREDRPLRAVLIGLDGAVPAAERPRLLVVAGLSPDHRVGTAVALRLGRALLDHAAEDPATAAALARYAVEILPLVNPDGLALLEGGPRRALRVNTRPVDDDRDGQRGEDAPEDLNGDGIISRMRIEEPGGEFRPSTEDERLLVRADRQAGERGAFRVLTEGVDNDGDGKINEDGPGGVDLDRNFPHGWEPNRPESGRSCPSEPESRALIDHVLATPEIAAVLVYGHEESLAAVPAANQSSGPVPPTGPPAEDLPWQNDVSRLFVDITKATGPVSAQDSGSFRQWAYYQAGLPAFSTPLWYPGGEGEPFTLPDGKAPTSPEGRLLALADREGTGFIEWLPYEHPTLGVVEIGGFNPRFLINPPARLLGPLVEGQVRFVTGLLERLPRPRRSEFSATNTGPGVFELKITLVNGAVLPAVTAMGRITRAPAPLRLELDLPRERVLQGRVRELIDRLDGHGGTVSYRWLIRGQPGDVVVLRLISARCGGVEWEVRL